MHQNKIPRPAENRIIRIGDGAVFLIFLQIRCVAPSMANTAIERKSGANPACKFVRPNSVDSAMLSAVARIIATTHGRTPDKKALTGAYFISNTAEDASINGKPALIDLKNGEKVILVLLPLKKHIVCSGTENTHGNQPKHEII